MHRPLGLLVVASGAVGCVNGDERSVAALPAHDLLEAQMRADKYYDFHVAIIRHGRRVCHKRRPNCDACVLVDRCPSAFDLQHSAP